MPGGELKPSSRSRAAALMICSVLLYSLSARLLAHTTELHRAAAMVGPAQTALRSCAEIDAVAKVLEANSPPAGLALPSNRMGEAVARHYCAAGQPKSSIL